MDILNARHVATVHTIKWRLLPDGGFVAGDPATGRTAYAYPNSAYAEWAKHNPAREAEMMLRSANRYGGPNAQETADYDARNWARMGAEVSQ